MGGSSSKAAADTKVQETDYDKYVEDNWSKYSSKCPTCQTCPTCETCEKPDYDKYVNDNWSKYETKCDKTCPEPDYDKYINDNWSKYESNCPDCPEPDYDKYVNDNWSKYESNCPACSCPEPNYDQYVKDNWSKYESNCPACKTCDYSNYVSKRDYDAKVAQLSLSDQKLSEAKKELQDYKRKLDEINSNIRKTIGDFSDYVGKWFMIVNVANPKLHVSLKEMKIIVKLKQVVLKSSYNKNTDLFTVDTNGRLISYGDRNSILCSDKSKKAVITIDKLDAAGTFSKNTAWCFENGLIKLTSDKSLNWDIAGGPGDVREGSNILTWNNDGGADQKWKLEVKEGFDVYSRPPLNITRLISCIIIVVCLFFLIRFIYGDILSFNPFKNNQQMIEPISNDYTY